MKSPDKKTKDVILVVDDQPNNLKVVSNVLGQDYSLSLAINGKIALDIVEKIKPDLILLDIMMPEIDGHEVLRRIKENEKTRDIPVIFLTAKTEIDEIVKCFNAGAVDYITKPFNALEVKVRVQNHLNYLHANRQLKSANAELKKINHEKDKFFSVISHDLRSPFATIVGIAELLADKNSKLSTEESSLYARNLCDNAKSTYGLLENLLEWSRMHRGTLPFSPEPINLTEFLNQCEDTTLEMARKKSIRIEMFTPGQIIFNADKNMLRSILRNLVTNAIKFSQRGGLVKISASKNDNGNILFTVKDNGIGMKHELLKKLFRIDTNVSRPGTEDEPSSGLGLILCKEFVEKHGGEIWADSEADKGSTFYFTLPAS